MSCSTAKMSPSDRKLSPKSANMLVLTPRRHSEMDLSALVLKDNKANFTATQTNIIIS